jgi:hypothetical protein
MSLRNLLLVSIALAAALGAYLFLGGSPVETSVEVRRDVERVAATEADAEVELAITAQGPAELGRRDAVEASAADASMIDHPWAEHLAGVTGRIIEEDGTPVVAIRVELLEGDLGALLEPEFTAMGHADLSAGESITDPEGRFLIPGAVSNGLHALAIDSGGGRSTLRVVEHGLEPGRLTDVGDIVLPRCGTVTGTVYDEDGEPVPGARVRIAPIPEIALQGTGILDLREKCMVAGADGGEALGVQLPDFLMANMKRLPIPTTTTAEDGTFRLEGVPFATVCGGVDKPGYVATVISTFTMNQEEHSVGELDLEVGRRVTGRVIDELGEPVVGAQVCAGVTSMLAPVGILQPTNVTAEDGTFEVIGISELGTPMASARRSGRDSWVTKKASGSDASVEVVLSAAARLVVRVEDEEGEPVSGADVKLREQDGKSEAIPALALSMLNIRTTTPPPSVEEREPGLYVVDALGLGEWVVRVESELHAPAESKITHSSEETECVITCRPARTVTAVVLDAATGLPIENAYVRVAGQSDRLLGGFAARFSDVEGRAVLGPLPRPGDKALERSMGWFTLEPIMTVEHPAYGSEGKLLPKESDQVVFEMTPACTLNGRVTWAGSAPLEIYMVSLVRRPSERGVGRPGSDTTMIMSMMMSSPRTTLTDLAGEFRFSGLAAGSYEMILSRRFLDSDPLEFIIKQQEPEVVMTQPVEIASGDKNFTEIELEPDGEAPRASFTGRVEVNGEGLAGARVTVTPGNRRNKEQPEEMEFQTNRSGEFRTDPLSTNDWVNIEIVGDVQLPGGAVEERELFSEWKKPSIDEDQNRIEVVLNFAEVVIEVLDADTGSPVVGAEVTIGGQGRRGWGGFRGSVVVEATVTVAGEDTGTDADGLVTVQVERTGKQRASVSHPEYEDLRTEVTLDPEGPAPHATLRLTRSVPCGGRAILPESFMESDSRGFSIRREGQRRGTQYVSLEDGADFSVSGLKPGTYTASAWAGRRRSKSVTFELGSQGNQNLVLEFEER